MEYLVATAGILAFTPVEMRVHERQASDGPRFCTLTVSKSSRLYPHGISEMCFEPNMSTLCRLHGLA